MCPAGSALPKEAARSSCGALPLGGAPRTVSDEEMRLGLADHIRFASQASRSTAEVDSVLAAPWFHERAHELARELGRDDTSVLKEATAHLHEISARHERIVVESWTRFGRWLLRGYDIISDDEQLARLRALDRKHSLIFL